MNLVVSHWSANVAVLAAGLAVAAVHLAGLHRPARPTHGAAGAGAARPG